MNEPIDHRSELNEGEKGGREFLVTGADADFLLVQALTESVGIKSFVGDDAAPTCRSQHGLSCFEVVARPAANETASARPCRSTRAASLVFSPPLVRPMACAD